jgi:hypothetical protein
MRDSGRIDQHIGLHDSEAWPMVTAGDGSRRDFQAAQMRKPVVVQANS